MNTQMCTPTVQTILANSCNDENRRPIMLNTSTLKKLGRSSGPLFAAILFLTLGNEWHLWICKTVVVVGLTFKVFTGFCLLKLKSE